MRSYYSGALTGLTKLEPFQSSSVTRPLELKRANQCHHMKTVMKVEYGGVCCVVRLSNGPFIFDGLTVLLQFASTISSTNSTAGRSGK